MAQAVVRSRVGKGMMGDLLSGQGNPTVVFGGLGSEFVLGASASMRGVEAAIRELANSEVPVLLLAESGAGKRAAAQRIHQLSRQGAKPFRSVACSMLKPEDMVRGNGHGVPWPGLFGDGTVYLEEVADLSPECQRQLLEVLPESNGDSDENRARLIGGSARDLEAEVKAGKLREDFYYRISGVCLRLPPLRQRREDIPGLLEHFLSKYAEDFHRSKPDLSAKTRRLLCEYAWPGNVRELEDAAKVLVVLENQEAATTGLRALQHKPEAAGESGYVSLKAVAKAASREAERVLILKALTRTRWNRRRAAKELQISYKALLYKLKQIRCEGYGAS